MQFGVVIPSQGRFGDPGAIRTFIKAAEELGFHTAWFGDHVIVPGYAAHLSPPNWFDSLACCITGAGMTKRLRFGTDVLVLPLRNPVELASVAASADLLSGGRLTLGVGIGYISGEFDAVGAPPYHERGRVTTEYLRVLRTLWQGTGPASFDGEYIRFQDVHPGPLPAQEPFPLWVGGNSARALTRAALEGTGWHPLFPTPEDYAAGRDRILSTREEHGRTGPFAFAMSCPGTQVLIDPDAAAGGPASLGDLGDIPEEYFYAPPFPTAEDGRARFVGTPAQLADDVRAYAEAGVEHLALRFWTVDPDATVDGVVDQMRRWQEQVAPLC